METKSLAGSAQAVARTLLNHKFKVILALSLGYGAKKCYDLYVFVKPFLQMKNQLQGGAGGVDLAKMLGGGAAGLGPEMPPVERTESQKTLDELMRESSELKGHLKLFKNTIKNINSTLLHQPRYL
jgi:hypothetical protein